MNIDEDTDRYLMMPSGLIVPTSVAEHHLRASRRPKAMDFFAGAGGFSLGLVQAGYEVVAAAENDPIAVMTYMTNLCRYGQVQMHFVTDADAKRTEKRFAHEFKRAGIEIEDGKFALNKKLKTSSPTAGSGWISHQPASTPGVSHIFVGDVRELSAQRILDTLGMKRGDLDVICGGPPCQGYSLSGKRDVYDPRNSLVFEFARFIVDLKPKAMIMEEVPNILNMVTPDGYPVIDKFCRILEDGGFGGFDAFSRALGANPKSVGLLRGKGTNADRKRLDAIAAKTDPAPKVGGNASAQADLFAEEAGCPA